MIYIRCCKCGKRMLHSQKCNCVSKRYKEDDKYKDKEKSKFYSSKEWQILRKIAINRFNGIDIYSYYMMNYIEYGYTIHHIETVEHRWDRRLDLDNLIYLTERNHRLLHERMKDNEQNVVDELFGLVNKWKNEMRITNVGGGDESFR